MKLLRLGARGEEAPVVRTDDGRFLDASTITTDFDGAFLASGGLDRLRAGLVADGLAEVDAEGVRVGAPVARPGKVVCIGLNYLDHAAETGAAIPSRPVVFMKDPGTVVGPYDDVLIPRGSTRTDWEVELAVVIGRRARYLTGPEDAVDVIAGYAISHDVSHPCRRRRRHAGASDVFGSRAMTSLSLAAEPLRGTRLAFANRRHRQPVPACDGLASPLPDRRWSRRGVRGGQAPRAMDGVRHAVMSGPLGATDLTNDRSRSYPFSKGRAAMRIALHTKVRADRVDEYEAAHREVPDELTEAIRAAGVSAWTIWRSGTDLFHMLEVPDYEAMIAELEKLPVNIAWQARMGELLAVAHDYSADGSDAALPVVWQL